MQKEEKQIQSFEELKQKTIEQLRSGKHLLSKGGAFGELFQELLQAAVDGEMEGFMTEDRRKLGNRLNGHNKKKVKTSDGEFLLETPRDRLGEFEPEIVKKRETILADNLESKIIGMYGLGLSLRDISSHIEEMYGTQISTTTLSAITDRVIPLVTEWQNRPLEEVYCIVWLDAMYYKVKDSTSVVTRCVYNILGVTIEGKKEVLGCYVAESEGAKLWLSILNNLNQRGLKDILIACIDNLKGFDEAIVTIFPKTVIQSCVVHQIRNSLKYVASTNQKEFLKELKLVYKADTRELGEQNLKLLADKWEKKYPIVINSWYNNWHKLSSYFAYPIEIRQLIYTTNTIEGYHRQIRKVTKTKGAFTNDMALLKLIYLASKNIEKKKKGPIKEWPIKLSQLKILFGDRLPLNI